MEPKPTGSTVSTTRPIWHPNDDENTEDAPKSKKQKVAIACDLCRSKKIKCDGVQPICGPCLRRRDGGSRCSWLHGLSRKDPQASKERILRLEKQIEQLTRRTSDAGLNIESSIGETRRSFDHHVPAAVTQNEPPQDRGHATVSSLETNSSAFSGPTSAMIGPSYEDDQLVGLYGSSSAGNFISQVRQVVEKNMGLSGFKESRSELDGEGFLTDESRRSQRNRVVDYVLPSRKRADDLMSVYWNAVHPLYPYTDKVETKLLYEQLWTGKELPVDEGEFLCIINVIFALSCQLNVNAPPEDRRSFSNIFFERAQEFSNLWKPGTLQTVQCFLLLAQYLQSTNEPHQCWMFAGHAVRTAESLGLHLPETSSQITSPRKRELVRRVWHGCVLMDRVLAMTSGKPTMIGRSTALGVPLPLPLDDEDLPSKPPLPDISLIKKSRTDFFIQSLKLYSIMYEILVGFYAPDSRNKNSQQSMHESYFGLCKYPGKGESILDIDRDLMNWEKDLPAHLKDYREGLERVSDGDVPESELILIRQAVVLRQRFIHVRLLSLRPILSSFVASDFDDSHGLASFGNILANRLAQQCSVVCVTIAQEAIHLVHITRSTDFATVGFMAAWWYNVLFVYSAATVLIAARLKTSIVSELGEDSIFSSWKIAMEVLEGYVSFSDSIPKLVATLKVLFDEVPLIYSHHRLQGAGDTSGARSVPRTPFHQLSREGSAMPQSNSNTSEWFGLTYQPNLQSTAATVDDASEYQPLMDLNGVAFDPNDLSWLDALPFEF